MKTSFLKKPVSRKPWETGAFVVVGVFNP